MAEVDKGVLKKGRHFFGHRPQTRPLVGWRRARTGLWGLRGAWEGSEIVVLGWFWGNMGPEN